MILKITGANHFKVLSFYLAGTLLMVVVLFFLRFEKSFLISFGGFWTLLTILVSYLHIEYYLENRGQCIVILDNRIEIESRNEKKRSYRFEDLKKIVLYKSASLDKGGMPILPMEFYHYARIVPKEGADIIITCLMISDVEEAVKKIRFVSYDRRKQLFATLDLK